MSKRQAIIISMLAKDIICKEERLLELETIERSHNNLQKRVHQQADEKRGYVMEKDAEIHELEIERDKYKQKWEYLTGLVKELKRTIRGKEILDKYIKKMRLKWINR
jgi:hypothetical protein